MKKNSKFMEVASRLWPNVHRQYEEMCVLAATGQLGGAQMCELNEHIARCNSCRDFLESVTQVSVQAMPLLADSRAPAAEMAPPDGMRERFLSRMAFEAGRAEAGPVLGLISGLDRQQLVVEIGKQPARGREVRAQANPWLKWSAGVAACLAVGVAGFYLGERRVNTVAQTALPGEPMMRAAAPAEIADRVNQLEEQKLALENQLTGLKQKLLNAKTEQDSLSGELAAARARLAAYTAQAQETSAASLAESQEAKKQAGALQSQVERLNRRLADSDVRFEVQQQTAEELTARLETTEAELGRERDLKAAKSEAGDLVAARNLHIIDVYDADNKGNRQRSYGRVFYVEGKSLIFYAYDLQDSRRLNGNVVFHVWGEKAGMKETTHSLGILRTDDASQSRWAMTFDDPKVLAQINSVFVTAESGNKRYDAPHGKKVLYAYFGSQPNHP